MDIKKFGEFLNENHIDYDFVDDFIRDNGFGDQHHVGTHGEDFEESDYYDNPKTSKEYGDQFLNYMNDLSNGKIEENVIYKYGTFSKKKILEGNFIGYKTPYDRKDPIMVIENNGKHSFYKESLIKEYNKEFKTPQGVWRMKKSKDDDMKYVDLDDHTIKETQIKTGIKYQFNGMKFMPKYTDGRYYTTIQPINNNVDGSDRYPSWVLYSKSLKELENDIRINIKFYKQEEMGE